ncbi:putative cell wall protein [Phragmites australis]|uniref:putative cell wall protein n=1 Tax=Phragmites australis TaxID=29695 RepID=UPI002D77EA05|nr:putative cell wall protein [Phragmites australis]
MAKSSSALLVLVVLAAAVQLGFAARPVPVPAAQQAASAASEEVKRPDTLQEGTVLIPGIGRYEIGSHYIPDITGLDHSIPAAANGKFLPGADDTWVPNPGFEIPNPFRPGSSAP